jgi:hypothetical protein
MRSDSDIKRDVEDELRWDPDLDATDIAVTVKSGVVTLAGFTRSYSDKLEAEAAAKRVAGVLGVANDIEVRLPALDQRPDPEIARDAIAAIKTRVPSSPSGSRCLFATAGSPSKARSSGTINARRPRALCGG